MAKMMGRLRPGHGQVCRYAGRAGCRCYVLRGQGGGRAKVLRRRAQRRAERAATRAED